MRARGFTLIEVLVAFAIASLALAVLFRGGIDGVSASRIAARTEEAAARAQSRLAAMCHGALLAPGTHGGDDGGGFAWRTEVVSAATANITRGSDDEPKAPLKATLFAVRVTVSWGEAPAARQVSLATSCLAVAAAAPA
jgi:general secretion pathway protein I